MAKPLYLAQTLLKDVLSSVNEQATQHDNRSAFLLTNQANRSPKLNLSKTFCSTLDPIIDNAGKFEV